MGDLADSAVTDACCTRCGYMLRGLAPDSKCPECGRSVAESLRPRFVTSATDAQIKRARLGIALWAVAILVPVLAELHVTFVVLTSPQHWAALMDRTSLYEHYYRWGWRIWGYTRAGAVVVLEAGALAIVLLTARATLANRRWLWRATVAALVGMAVLTLAGFNPGSATWSSAITRQSITTLRDCCVALGRVGVLLTLLLWVRAPAPRTILALATIALAAVSIERIVVTLDNVQSLVYSCVAAALAPGEMFPPIPLVRAVGDFVRSVERWSGCAAPVATLLFLWAIERALWRTLRPARRIEPRQDSSALRAG